MNDDKSELLWDVCVDWPFSEKEFMFDSNQIK